MTITYDAIKNWLDEAKTRNDGGVEDPIQALQRLGVVDDAEAGIDLLLDASVSSGGDLMIALSLLTGIAIALDLERAENHVGQEA